LRMGKMWTRFLCYLEPPSGKDVHKPSMAHPAKIFKSARRKLAFLHGKSNAHFIFGKLASWISSHLQRCPQYVESPFSLTHKGSFSIVLPIKSKVSLNQFNNQQLNQPPTKMRDRTYNFGCVHPGCCSSSDVQTTQMPERMNRSS